MGLGSSRAQNHSQRSTATRGQPGWAGDYASTTKKAAHRPGGSGPQGGIAMWNQVYNPFGNAALSTLAAALPVVTLLALIASNKVKAHFAAIIALIVANLVAIYFFTMPPDLSLRASVLGAVTGFFPIGWIVLNVIFLYRLTVEKGAFEILQQTIGGGPTHRRLP